MQKRHSRPVSRLTLLEFNTDEVSTVNLCLQEDLVVGEQAFYYARLALLLYWEVGKKELKDGMGVLSSTELAAQNSLLKLVANI